MQRGRLRASDADREVVAERLRNAAAEGRIVAHELEERVALALRARTYGELEAVVADLPRTRVARRPTHSLARPALAVAIVLAALVVVAFTALVITGLATVWALCVVCLWCARGRGHRYRRQLRRGAQLPVARQADRRAWL